MLCYDPQFEVCVCVCVCVSEWVCVCVRERERVGICVYVIGEKLLGRMDGVYIGEESGSRGIKIELV